jgi:hypothetical protein
MMDEIRAQHQRWIYSQPWTTSKPGPPAAIDTSAETLMRHGLQFLRSVWWTAYLKLRLKETT